MQAQAGPAVQRAGAISPMSEDSYVGSGLEEDAPSVKQPPLQVHSYCRQHTALWQSPCLLPSAWNVLLDRQLQLWHPS